MVIVPMFLGGIRLLGTSVPEEITLGGDQRLAIHELPGGGRVIDVMGAQEHAIAWTGVFVGHDAADRARQIDLLRRSGRVFKLSFEDYDIDVIIEQFRYSYGLGGSRIPYRIRCQPLIDDADVIPGADIAITTALALASKVLSEAGNANAQAAAGLVSGLATISSVRAYSADDLATTTSIQAELASISQESLTALAQGRANGFPATASAITAAVQGAGGLASSVLAGNSLKQASLILSGL